jgi:hypothetical protein
LRTFDVDHPWRADHDAVHDRRRELAAVPDALTPRLVHDVLVTARLVRGQVLGKVGTGGLLGHLLIGPGVQSAVQVVGREGGHVPGPDRQRRRALPLAAEPDRLGQLGVAQLAGQQRHAASGLDGGELGVVAGDDHFRAAAGRVPQYAGQVGHRGCAGLIQQDLRSGAEGCGTSGLAHSREVAEELRSVLRHSDPGLLEDVPGG